MKKKSLIVSLSILAMMFPFFGCNATQREPYKLSPVSDFILALNEQDVSRIDDLVSSDVVFKYKNEEFYYLSVREAFLTLRDENEVYFYIYDYYGSYTGKKDQLPRKVFLYLPLRIDTKIYFIDAVYFEINAEGKICLVESDSEAFKYLISIEGRE